MYFWKNKTATNSRINSECSCARMLVCSNAQCAHYSFVCSLWSVVRSLFSGRSGTIQPTNPPCCRRAFQGSASLPYFAACRLRWFIPNTINHRGARSSSYRFAPFQSLTHSKPQAVFSDWRRETGDVRSSTLNVRSSTLNVRSSTLNVRRS